MNFDERVWKTGLIAVISTIVFGVFLFRSVERTRNGEFLPGAAVTRVLPQVAVGSFDGGLKKYTTIIQITNPGATAVMIAGNFFKEEPNGGAGTRFPLPFETNEMPARTIPAGSFSPIALAPSASVTLTGASSGVGYVGWGRIASTGSIFVGTVLELRDVATNVLYSRVAVAASAADMKSFMIPHMRNSATGLDVAFALVNTGATSATITATLYNAAGNQVGSPRVLSVASLGHMSQFGSQLFSLLSGEAADNSYIRLSSASGQWAAMALGFEGVNLTSFPIERLE